MSESSIESQLQETRLFPPKPEFAAVAHVQTREQYERMYRESLDSPETFWAKVAGELTWFAPWSKVLDWKVPTARWFVGGKTNLSHNCLDRQIDAGRGDKTAILWEGEPIEGGHQTRRERRRTATSDGHIDG